MRCYGPGWVLVLFALLITAGVPVDVVLIPFLLTEAVAVVVHIYYVREEFLSHRNRRHY